MDEAIIVGIDPGNTSAVAAVNLEGEVVLLESERELAQSDIIQLIIDTGKPVVVASDREKMPSTVEKVASSLGAEKFNPDEDLGRQRKKDIAHGDNSHERDALASAIHAYNSLSRAVKKINHYAEKTGSERTDIAENYFSGDLSGGYP